MKHILVTGGAGFIGSHTCLMLLESGFKISIVDSFINSNENSINRVRYFLQKKGIPIDGKIKIFNFDLRDAKKLEDLFKYAFEENNKIQGVIHFSGLKSVYESQKKPLLYWDVNLLGTINLLKVMNRFDCNLIVFSSSATIYDSKNNEKISEEDLIKPINTYGKTKNVIENILSDLYISSPKKWKIANLRYFNPIGAHPSGIIGEEPKGKPNNIFPLINKVAIGDIKEIKIYGDDWPTQDGTGVRDYIHVMDLAKSHLLVMQHLFANNPKILNLNVGTGIGTSVLQLINIFQKINKVKIPYIFEKRRDGDLGIVIAENSKLKRILNWQPSISIEDMCKDGWNWQKKNPKGYL